MAGTDRAMTLAQIDTAMQAAYTDGGQPNMLVVSPAKKAAFSDLNGGSVSTNPSFSICSSTLGRWFRCI